MPEPPTDRLSLIDGRRLPAQFRLRVVTLPVGARRHYDEAEWRDALVVIESGEVELECHAGGSRRFDAGTVLWFQGLSLECLHSCGSEPAVLAAVSRRGAPASADD